MSDESDKQEAARLLEEIERLTKLVIRNCRLLKGETPDVPEDL